MTNHRLALLGLLVSNEMRLGPDPLANVNIAREYELIQQKSSTLSRIKRDLVVYRMKRYQEWRENDNV